MARNDSEAARAQLRIVGRVQGVYFRASACQEGQSLGLAGWVRNCPDGSVEIVAEGTRANLEQLIAWCHRGPPGARVMGSLSGISALTSRAQHAAPLRSLLILESEREPVNFSLRNPVTRTE